MDVVCREQALTDLLNMMFRFRDRRDGSETRFEEAAIILSTRSRTFANTPYNAYAHHYGLANYATFHPG